MENFKDIISVIVRTIGSLGLGFGASRMFFNEDYKTASWILFIASISFMVGYFVELSNN